ncbi:sensor histidine kinase [Paramicrobacterium agarici]|uniref:histidine kinase n=1 Tax=Paramicrobacterium agarici TaxID=630514 RepID=A0A2A9DWD1_9MICO|nr:ATP-binding protein [Microbacterium agarici]PFG30884.1 signal transduction histidine kinase [Microbacterium agarici]
MAVWREIASSAPGRQQRESLEYFDAQHAQLVAMTTLSFSIVGTAMSFVAMFIPGAIALGWLPAAIAAHLALAAAAVWAWRGRSLLRQACVVGAGLLTLVVITAGVPPAGINFTMGAALCVVAGWGIGSLAVSLTATRGGVLAIGAVFIVTELSCLLLAESIDIPAANVGGLIGLVTVLWVLCLVFGIWLVSSRSRVIRRIVSIGRAHNLERRASETEAARLRDARLLHDTALATLSLLAHSGVGVDPDTLRAQAASDRELLARLRRGESPSPRASGQYTLTNTAELQLGETLEAVKNRFNGTELAVTWHGSGQLGLAHAKLDAFMHALTECVENVRRHAHVSEAHVTLSDDGVIVRGVVTDAGVGFDPSQIPDQHMGFRESVVARIEEISGTVRVFSSPGAGTTVVLEVPK